MLSLLVQLFSVFLLSPAFISDIQALPITTIIQNLTFNEYYYQPTVYFIYKVDLNSFQQYIDPQFTVISPYNNGSAYIVLQVGNMTAYYNGGTCYHCLTFTYLQSLTIYTIVQYNNTLYREVLATSFNFTPPAIVGNLYQNPPYGSSQMNKGVTFSASNATGIYDFSSSTTVPSNILTGNVTATINFSLNFNNNNVADYTNQGTLAGFYLGTQNNKNEIQSSYRKGESSTPKDAILTGYLSDIVITEVINCTDVHVASTYIQTIVGNIQGLDENNPVACYFSPYTHFDSVAVTPKQSRK